MNIKTLTPKQSLNKAYRKWNILSNELESEIDIMVYKLYELTYEEVKVIDPAFALSE